MSDEWQGRLAREERAASERPPIPWYDRLWHAVAPDRIASVGRGARRTSATALVVAVVVLVAVISANVASIVRENHKGTLLIVADGSYASGQEGNIIESLESQGFADAEGSEGTGVTAYGTADMVAQYVASYKEKNLDDADAEMGKDHADVGVASVMHDDGWGTITLSTYTNDVDTSLVQYMLTQDADLNEALSTWIAYAAMANGELPAVRLIDVSGAEYFSVEGVSSPADVTQAVSDAGGGDGVDWEQLMEETIDGSDDDADESEEPDDKGTDDGDEGTGDGDEADEAESEADGGD